MGSYIKQIFTSPRSFPFGSKHKYLCRDLKYNVVSAFILPSAVVMMRPPNVMFAANKEEIHLLVMKTQKIVIKYNPT